MIRGCVECGYPFRPAAAHHRQCWDCWHDRNGSAGSSRAPSAVSVGLDAATLRDAVALCHPDRDPVERQAKATLVTQALTAALERTRELERAA